MSFQCGVCWPQPGALLILSLLWTIIVLTEQQAVAYVVAAPTASNESLAEILPHDNVSNTSSSSSSSKLLSALGPERSFNQPAMKGLTPGQQVINAVPDKERNDFIMYQLTVALKRTYGNATGLEFVKYLDDLLLYYGEKITDLEKLPVYENFPTDLLRWVRQENKISHPPVLAQVRSQTEIWCNSQGICYVFGSNIGCHCCPF